MKRTLTRTTIAALALIAASAAHAGDYESGIVTKSPSDGYTPVEYGSGWYIRGDITYNVNGRSETTIANVVGLGAISAEYDDAIGARVGFGYYVTPNIRLEMDVEAILDSTFEGLGGATFAAADSLDPAVVSTGGTQEIDASYSLSDFIVSANLDLPSIGNFTPYVGAGGGIARVAYSETQTLTCIPTAATVACTGFPSGAAGETATVTTTYDEESWTYAYQLTAGTAYRLNEHTSLDFSYSFTQIGDGDEINYADGTAIDRDGIQLHQVRAGIRYELW